MPNKYNMTVEDNIFLAKRNLVDSIWKEANIEGIGVTFPDTKEIFEGRTVPGLTVDETVAINNLKHGWQFVLDTLDAPVDLAYVRQVNGVVGAGIIAQPGELRCFDVGIGGTSWKPEIPDFDSAKAMIAEISALDPGQDRALLMFAALCRAQLFSDGNKRTAQLVANKMLIGDGAGILAIPVEHKARFEGLLIDYYESNDPARFLSFVADVGVDGIDVPRPAESGQQASKSKGLTSRQDARPGKGPDAALGNASRSAASRSARQPLDGPRDRR